MIVFLCMVLIARFSPKQLKNKTSKECREVSFLGMVALIY